MLEKDKKILKETLKNEVSPLLIGLRNEIKKNTDEVKKSADKNSKIFVELNIEELQKKTNEEIEKTVASAKFNGEKGDRGESGKSIKGNDGKEAKMGKAGKTPKKGIDYFTQIEIDEFLKIATPVKNRDYFDGINGKDGKDGANAQNLEASDIRDMLESLVGAHRLKTKAIHNFENEVIKIIGQNTSNESGIGGSGSVTGATAFLGLTDTPHSYTGQGGMAVYVKANESGLEFKTAVSTDEKVAYKAGSTAGYLGAVTVAGTGISLAEGTGADAGKLQITNSDLGSSAVSAHNLAYNHSLIATALQSVSGTNLDNIFTGNGFLKRTGAGTYTNDTNIYLTSLSGAVLTDQTVGQTIGATGARLTKLWATDITVTNKISGSITGNADGSAGSLSGQYIDWSASSGGTSIANKPSIPAAQIQSDWNQTNNALLDYIKNKPTIPAALSLGSTTRIPYMNVGGTDFLYSAGHTFDGSKLSVTATTKQLQLGYDTSNYFSTTVGSAGSTTFALTGTTPTFTFSQTVNVNKLFGVRDNGWMLAPAGNGFGGGLVYSSTNNEFLAMATVNANSTPLVFLNGIDLTTGFAGQSGTNAKVGLWQQGGHCSIKNWNEGAGTQTTPTALLVLGAGTATASTAPLKFTTGVNLSTVELGAVEFADPNLTFTQTGILGGETFSSFLRTNWTLNTGWDSTNAGDTKINKNAAGTGTAILNTPAPTIGTSYTISITCDTFSGGGTIVVKYGGQTLSFTPWPYFYQTGTLTATITASTTAGLTFTPDTSATRASFSDISIKTATVQRRSFVFSDSGNLTSGRVPYAFTNGRLIDSDKMTFATDTLTVTKIVGTTSIKVGTAGGFISSDNSTGATGSFTTVDLKTVTVKDGIITSIV